MTRLVMPFAFVITLPLTVCSAVALADDDVRNDEFAQLIKRIDAVIAKVRSRELNTLKDTPWVIMHAVIAFEKDLDVVDVDAGKKVNAIDYLCQDAKFEGKSIFRSENGQPVLPTRGISFGLRESFKVQDHVDQFLMAFADADVSLEKAIVAEGGKKFTVGDLLKAAKANVKDDQELGWTLVATAVYLSLDEQWTASSGKKHDIEQLVELAVRRDPRRETEGGPHHLYGVAFALEKYRGRYPGDLPGVWAKARAYLDQYIRLAKEYQRKDGSFSATMFRSSRPASSPRQMVWATGHTLEWFTVSMSAKQLKEDWVRSGVESLLKMLEEEPLDAFSDGGLYHAAHALRRYKEKIGQ
jgi:hypothetical protein